MKRPSKANLRVRPQGSASEDRVGELVQLSRAERWHRNLHEVRTRFAPSSLVLTGLVDTARSPRRCLPSPGGRQSRPSCLVTQRSRFRDTENCAFTAVSPTLRRRGLPAQSAAYFPLVSHPRQCAPPVLLVSQPCVARTTGLWKPFLGCSFAVAEYPARGIGQCAQQQQFEISRTILRS